jgi:hypothetical protein
MFYLRYVTEKNHVISPTECETDTPHLELFHVLEAFLFVFVSKITVSGRDARNKPIRFVVFCSGLKLTSSSDNWNVKMDRLDPIRRTRRHVLGITDKCGLLSFPTDVYSVVVFHAN